MDLISGSGTGGSASERVFQYVHSPEYASVQRDFDRAVDSMDINQVVRLLQWHPFHVDANLQIAEYHRSTGQLPEATEFLRRALYVLESVWHPLFRPAEAPCRVPYSVPLNRCVS